MKPSVSVSVITNNSIIKRNINLELPRACPICSVSYGNEPLIAYCVDIDEYKSTFAYAIYFCPHCERCFYVTYNIFGSLHDNSSIREVYPIKDASFSLSDPIKSLSPRFVEIYTQARTAEANNLDEICGLGYRKALEFLIKDYSIKLKPDEANAICTETLSQCIKNHIDSDRIKSLAKASAWLGNDETHYVRKHDDYGLKDLKAFLSATIAYIEYELSYINAQQLINPTSEE